MQADLLNMAVREHTQSLETVRLNDLAWFVHPLSFQIVQSIPWIALQSQAHLCVNLGWIGEFKTQIHLIQDSLTDRKLPKKSILGKEASKFRLSRLSRVENLYE